MACTRNKPLVICGHGMVAQRLLEQLVKFGHPYSRIVVFNGEPFSAYNRIQLSSLLANQIREADLELKPWQWFHEHRIDVHLHEPVTRIAPSRQEVITSTGRIQPYQALIIATGARPSGLGIPGESLTGVLHFRSLTDTRELIHEARKQRRAVVVGGGFLGLEAAEGLRSRGMDVTVMHRSDHLLNRQLNPAAGEILQQQLHTRGLHILTNTAPVALLGRDRVRAVQLNNGTVLATDLVVIATGITPNTQLAASAGLACDRGIQVNAQLQTSTPDIYALGECCQFQNHVFGLVEPGYQQARILAKFLSGASQAPAFAPARIATRLKISDLPIFSCGETAPAAHTDVVEWHDKAHGVYGQLLIGDDRLTGAVLLGDTTNGPWYSELIRSGTDISRFRDAVAFGKPYCNAAA